jgi:hypothetical protein
MSQQDRLRVINKNSRRSSDGRADGMHPAVVTTVHGRRTQTDCQTAAVLSSMKLLLIER